MPKDWSEPVLEKEPSFWMHPEHARKILQGVTSFPSPKILEMGGGGSTFLLARVAKILVTIETDPGWRKIISAAGGIILSSVYDDWQQYGPFDIILVDGQVEPPDKKHWHTRMRFMRMVRETNMLEFGGLIFLHDSQGFWYRDVKKLFTKVEETLGPVPDNKTTRLWVGTR